MTLTKNTMVGMSLATMITFVGAIWMASAFLQTKSGMIDANAAGVAYLTERRISDIIRDLKSDKRELEADLRHDPKNEYVIRDIDSVVDDIDYYINVLECLRTGKETCE